MSDVITFKLTWFDSLTVSLVTLVLCCYGVTSQVFGTTLRPEKVLILAALGVLLAVIILRGGRVRVSRAESLLAGWLAVSVLSSLLSQNPGTALLHTLDLGISVAVFFVASSWKVERIILASSKPILRVGILLGMGSIAVALVLVSGMLPAFPFMGNFVMVEPYANLVRVKMTMWEANLFGAVMMVFALLSVAEFRRDRLFSWVILITAHAGFLLAYSRGPIVGYLAGLLVYCHFLGYRRVKRALLLLTLCVVVISGVYLVMIAMGSVKENVYMRYGSLLPRVASLQIAFEDILSAPFLGSGTYSFDFMHSGFGSAFGAEEETKAWIGVMPVAVLHDTGMIGFVLLWCFFQSIIREGVRNLRLVCSQATFSLVPRRMAAWLGASVGMLLLSLTTSAYSLAAFWMVMVMVASFQRVTIYFGYVPAISSFIKHEI